MKTLILTSSLLSLVTMSSLARADDANSPVGGKATYTIDTTSGRTTGLVQGGTFTMTVGDLSGTSYASTLEFNVDLSIIGNRTGSQELDLPAAYFAPDFMANLRSSKHFESTQFKIDYLGTEDVTTLDGHTYNQTDKIRIYDIKIDVKSPFYNLTSNLLQSSATVADFTAGPSPIPKNMQVIADIAPGVPALGAVRLDLSGSQGIVSIKAGADLQAP